ncbi:uncharacterized protein SPAR_G02540 [Saccharomyces paradoxus]|uniref:YGR026W-like protein n=1 Tax=Saccharomyces paradoxus TaxID=27291 RepID=A0A8B8URS2_SACPA|nr:uncharacterized protein SPAR_G02540 [Saccharomyces paradoxus]QHS73344.1 hypothetical protein SPAR_G02540 [Saccharomyces paradoxus]
MAKTIEVIRKKDPKKKNQSDPLAKQKLIWKIGHALTLVFGLLFSITYFYHVLIFFKYRSWKWLFLRVNKNYSFIQSKRWYMKLLSWGPQIMYRLSLIGVFMSESVTMQQNWVGLNPTWNDLLSSENFHTLLIACLWFFGGGKSFYKILPYMILSYLHLTKMNYELNADKEERIPLTPRDKKMLHLLAYSELFVILALTLDTVLFKTGTSGFMLVIYVGIYWLRLNFSPYAQVAVLELLVKSEKYVPKKYRGKWQVIKNFVYMKMKEHGKRTEEVARYA